MIALLLLAAAATTTAIPVAEMKRSAAVDFGKELYPILKRNCLACHNTTKAKGGLNLESPADILKGGDSGPAVTAGRGADSLLVRTAAHLEDPAMPPAGNKVNAVDLTPAELGLLQLWIDQGATGSAVTAATPIVWRGFPGRAAPVTAAAVSPGGVLVAAARGNQVELTEVATGMSLGFLSDPQLAGMDTYRDRPAADRDAVMAVAFGSESLLATSGYRTVRLWRREVWPALRKSLALPEPAVSAAAAGTWAAAGDATGRVVLWDASIEKPVPVELKDHVSPVNAVALSPDEKFLVSTADDRSVSVWFVPDRRVVFRAESPAPISALAFVQQGSLLAAAGTDGRLRVYPFSPDAPPASATPVRDVRLGDKAPAFLTNLAPAGSQILWGTGDAVLHVLDAATGEPVRQVTCEHPGQKEIARAEHLARTAQRHAEGRTTRAAAAADAAKKECESARTSNSTMAAARAEWQRKLATATAAAEAVRAQPDDKPRQDAAAKATAASLFAERTFLNARTNAELAIRLASQALHSQIATDAAQSAAVSAVAEANASLEAAKKLPPFPTIKSATVLPDGRTVVLTVDGARAHWHSLESGSLLDTAELAAPLVVVANDHLLALQPDQQAVLLPLRRPWRHDRTLGSADDPAPFSDRVTALSFSSDARLLATGGGIPSRSGEAKIWNVSDGSLALALKDPHSDTVNALAFSPDDLLLATAGSDRWARVFRVADGTTTASFEGHSAHVLSIAWRGDGLALATGGADKSLRTWDVPDSRQIASNTSFTKEVSAVGWLGTTDVMASASGDATVRLNDDRLPGAGGFAFCLATDQTGSILASGGEDGILRVWTTADKNLLRELSPATPAP